MGPNLLADARENQRARRVLLQSMSPPNTQRIGLLAVATVLILSGMAFFLGFYLLPSADGPASLWQRMCRAAGVVPAKQGRPTEFALPLHTNVVLPRSA